MKKIIFGITSLTLGGAERVLVDICNRLSEKYDITIFTLYSNGNLEKEISQKVCIKSLYNKSYKELTRKEKIFIPIKVFFRKKKYIQKIY